MFYFYIDGSQSQMDCRRGTCALCSWSWIIASSCLLISSLDLSLWLVASAFSYICKTSTSCPQQTAAAVFQLLHTVQTFLFSRQLYPVFCFGFEQTFGHSHSLRWRFNENISNNCQMSCKHVIRQNRCMIAFFFCKLIKSNRCLPPPHFQYICQPFNLASILELNLTVGTQPTNWWHLGESLLRFSKRRTRLPDLFAGFTVGNSNETKHWKRRVWIPTHSTL